MLQVSNLARHGRGPIHLASLASLIGASSVAEDIVPKVVDEDAKDEHSPWGDLYAGMSSALVGGVSNTVPRIDRFCGSLSIVLGHGSHSDLVRTAASSAVGSSLTQGGPHNDSSHHACAKMIVSMGQSLRNVNFKMLRNARKIGLSYDVRKDVLLLYGRILVKSDGIYECLIGLKRDFGTTASEVETAMLDILKSACTLRQGRRSKDLIAGPGDVFKPVHYNHVRECIRSGASDGGTAEAKALYECSALATEASKRIDPVFKNMMYVLRDTAHKLRDSVGQFFFIC
jgi:hypothetical protein